MKTLAVILSMIFLSFYTLSQTPVPESDVSGQWTKEGSPYLIGGEITIPQDQTLTVEPGVQVIFQGHYKFIIQGTLLAMGNQQDSIIFTAADVETGWHSLRFLDTETSGQDSSRIMYCVIEKGIASGSCPDNRGAGIFMSHAHPTITHCTIKNNKSVNGAADWGGGGIYCDYSNAIISYNMITGNYSGHDGGGIYCSFSIPLISHNVITDNEAAFRGGGIAVFSFSSPIIFSNEIRNNRSGSLGGAIYQSGGNSMVQHNIIESNNSGEGGGICCYLSDSRIVNNLIISNEAGTGAAISNKGSSPLVVSNTIDGNIATSMGGGIYNGVEFVGVPIYSDPPITNTILYSNEAAEGSQMYSVTGCVPVVSCSDIESLSSTGIYGDIQQGEGNLESEPLYDSGGLHPYALTGSSMCIDRGTAEISGLTLPETDILGNIRVWDGDGDQMAVVDIGAYEFGAPGLGIGVYHDPLDSNPDCFNYPNPCRDHTVIKYTISDEGSITLDVLDLKGAILHPLVNGRHTNGEYLFFYDVSNLPSGIYILRMRSPEGATSWKMMVE
jgi:predicted outer membrane repeat protein